MYHVKNTFVLFCWVAAVMMGEHAHAVVCYVDGPKNNGSCNTTYVSVPKNGSITINTLVNAEGSSVVAASATGTLKRSDGITVHSQSLSTIAGDSKQRIKTIKNSSTSTKSYRGELSQFQGPKGSFGAVGVYR